MRHTITLTNRKRPTGWPVVFYRVSFWDTGLYIADFDNEAEARAFAIKNARESGCRFDHKVERLALIGR